MKKTIWLIVAIAMVAMMDSCKTIKVVEQVPVHDTLQIVQKEVQKQVDTMIVERETIVREADSALLQSLGIQLKDKERALLVLQRELLVKSQQLNEQKTDAVMQKVEVPVPIDKTEYVEKPLKWWQKSLMWTGVLSLLCLIVYVIVKTGLWRWIKR